MKKHSELLAITIAFAFLFSTCSIQEQNRVKTGGPEIVDFRFLPSMLNDVKLLDGPFLHATELNRTTLLNYDPDKLLSRFYDEAGLKPKASRYLGWENESLAGHSLGHYLSGCALMYQTTGDERFRQGVDGSHSK